MEMEWQTAITFAGQKQENQKQSMTEKISTQLIKINPTSGHIWPTSDHFIMRNCTSASSLAALTVFRFAECFQRTDESVNIMKEII